MNITQKYKRNFGTGWWRESFRHSLASRGIKTKKYMKKFARSYNPKLEEVTAARRFGGKNIQQLPKLGEGRDRNVFELPEQDVVVKIAKNPGGLIQNIHEGDYVAPVVEIEEKGKDFVVAKKADLPSEKTKVMLKDLKKFNQQDFDNKTEELQEVLDKHGLSDLMNYDVAYGDLTRKANWGEVEGEPVLIDAGTLNKQVILEDFRLKDIRKKAYDPDEKNQEFYRIQLKEWEDIKRERKKYQKVIPKKFQAKKDWYKSKVVGYYERDGLKIPITERQTYDSHRYPISVEDLKKSLNKIPTDHLKGIEEFSFRPPSRLPFTDQTKAWAQYADGANRVNVYSQPFKETKEGFRYKRATKDYDEYPELKKQIQK